MKLTSAIKTTFLATAITATLAACSITDSSLDSENPGGDISNNETYNKTPLLVFLGETDFFSITATRGMGPFENKEDVKKKNAKICVYAFRNSTQEPLTEPADLRKTRYANGMDQDTINESCLLDGYDYNSGMVMKLNENDGQLRQDGEKQKLYYSNTYQNVGYNFFAYYTDDCKLTCNRRQAKDKITYEFDVDGTQDILFGAAPALTMNELNTTYKDLTLSAEEKSIIVGANGYSTFAAHRDVHPHINLSHAMARFVFQAYPGDETAKDIKITKIEMLANKRCTLTVAGRTTDVIGAKFDENNKGWMVLRDKDENGVYLKDGINPTTVSFEPEMNDMEWYDRKCSEVGSSMLLAPDSTYKMIIYYSQLVDNGTKKEWRPMSTEYTIKAPKAPNNDNYNYDEKTGCYIYKPGYQYTVKIAVFGLSEIKVSVNIDEWKEDTNNPILINPDNADKENI